MAAKTVPAVIPAGVKFLSHGEVERLRELISQRDGGAAVANTAVQVARQLAAAVDSEVEGLKAHYGIDKQRRVEFDLAKLTLTLLPEETNA